MQVDFSLLIPELLLAGLGVLVLTADFALPWGSRRVKNGSLAALTALGLAAVFVIAIAIQPDESEILYDAPAVLWTSSPCSSKRLRWESALRWC